MLSVINPAIIVLKIFGCLLDSFFCPCSSWFFISFGKRKMYSACVNGEVEKVKQLLKGQPDLLQDEDLEGRDRSALTAASSYGQTQVVEVLLGAGAEVNQVDYVYFFLLVEFQRWKNLSFFFFFFFFFLEKYDCFTTCFRRWTYRRHSIAVVCWGKCRPINKGS